MKKWIIRGILGLVVLLVAGVLITWAMIDGIAKGGVEKGGVYAMGVPTKVDNVNLSLLKGTFKMNALHIANPEGFSSPHLLKSGQFDLEVRPGSIFSDTVEVSHFILDGLDVNIEQKGVKNNISTIMDHVKQLGGGEAQPASPQAQPQSQAGPPKKAESGKKIKVDKVSIKNVVAHVLLPVGGPLEIKLPAIELTNVSSDQGVQMGQFVAKLVPAVLAAIVEKGGDVIPKDLSAFMTKDLSAATKALGGNANRLMAQGQQEAAKAIQDAAGKVVGDLQKNIGGAPLNVGGALRGLTPGSIPSH